jgi:hypothetical protein
MQEEALCDIMMWNMNEPSVKELDPTKAINQWYFSSKTTRHGQIRNNGSKCSVALLFYIRILFI